MIGTLARIVVFSLLAGGLAGCGGLRERLRPTEAAAPPPELAAPATRPLARPAAGARTAEQFDTTTPQQRAAAAAPPPSGARSLGTTIASLGSPTQPGFWLKTPLVKAETPGRVTNPATGKSAAVTLIPIPGPATAGSRMSLPALRLIGAPLGALTEVEVATTG